MMRYPVVCMAICLLAFPVHGQEKKAARKGAKQADAPAPDQLVTYKEVNGKSLQLNLFKPARESTSTGSPAIVFFFGGGWNNGSTTQFSTHCRYLADRGMVAIAADYRVYSRDKAQVIDCVADAQDAMLYVREHARELNIDSNRVAAGGGSAGGHLAAAVATLAYRGTKSDVKPERYRPSALVLFNPAAVLATIPGKDEPLRDNQSLLARMGDKPESISPYHNLSSSLPPTLILHGTADPTVPYWTVEAFRDRATELGAKCKLVGFDQQVHGFFNVGREKFEAARDEMATFLSGLGYIRL